MRSGGMTNGGLRNTHNTCIKRVFVCLCVCVRNQANQIWLIVYIKPEIITSGSKRGIQHWMRTRCITSGKLHDNTNGKKQRRMNKKKKKTRKNGQYNFPLSNTNVIAIELNQKNLFDTTWLTRPTYECCADHERVRWASDNLSLKWKLNENKFVTQTTNVGNRWLWRIHKT